MWIENKEIYNEIKIKETIRLPPPPPAPPINIIFFYESSSPYLKNDATCLDFWTDTYIKTH